MQLHSYYEYYTFNGANFFTLVLKPAKTGEFPVVVMRSPYVRDGMEKTHEELVEEFTNNNLRYAENNYAVVFQHCRGQGKSTGDFIPYIHEREDGLALREWIRKQDFYNGQLFLLGASYTASLHYSTAPFEDDIIGAVFNVQDSERYRLWYRNGNMRRGHANWHFELYKANAGLRKSHTMESFSQLPIKNLSQRVLGERAEDFEQMLSAPVFEHSFWSTRFGGVEARDAISKARIPILLTTGYNDFYVGGMFKMWGELEKETMAKCAMIVSPYDHGDSFDRENGMEFLKGSVTEQFGEDYAIKWFDAIIKEKTPFVEPGKITYYRIFENAWATDFYSPPTREMVVTLGAGDRELAYDPKNPPAFVPEGMRMDAQDKRSDVISLYTQPMDTDVFVKGKMKMSLTVASDCEDTSFYVMVGIRTENGDYALRHDITSILYQKDSYIQNRQIVLNFEFDEHAFAVEKGQSLRIDIAPTDKNTYVCHTNKKGDYSCADRAQKAKKQSVFRGIFFNFTD